MVLPGLLQPQNIINQRVNPIKIPLNHYKVPLNHYKIPLNHYKSFPLTFMKSHYLQIPREIWQNDGCVPAAFGLAFLLGIGPTLGEGGRTATSAAPGFADKA